MKLFTVKERAKALLAELNRVVDIIKNEYKPHKIILFGSFALGEIHEWSDIDLLIIKETGKTPIERCMEIAHLVHPKVGIDFFVYTPEEYESLEREKYSFVMKILKQGKVLYEEGN